MPSPSSSRRSFLARTSIASPCLLGDFSFLSGLGSVSAQEAAPDPKGVRLRPEIAPTVRLLEETPRDRLLEEVGSRIKSGRLNYQQILAALQLAGVRNVQPRPVGFKFHCVLVVNSAHLASLSSPDQDRWLPIFWALDYYKKSEAEDVNQNNWTMASVDESKVPPAHKAKQAFIDAMDQWDVDAADAAVAGFARHGSKAELFELFTHYGARDFRDIGHKAIFVANSFRALETIGWQHAEPILRCLAYALLDHESTNPAERDSKLDRAWRLNHDLEKEIPTEWLSGKPDPDAVNDLLETLRYASTEDAARTALKHLKNGLAPQSIWDAGFQFSTELLMRNPGIIALHAVTTANALRQAYQLCGEDRTRRLMTLQFIAYLTHFRQDPKALEEKEERIHLLKPADLPDSTPEALDAIFTEVTHDRHLAARRIFALCQRDPEHAKAFIANARRLLYMKGKNAHDYKFTSAVLEDYYQISPGLREAFMAASVFNLRGSQEPDNKLVERSRAALG